MKGGQRSFRSFDITSKCFGSNKCQTKSMYVLRSKSRYNGVKKYHKKSQYRQLTTVFMSNAELPDLF